jgi:NAD(P)-dependent dehydrogenase (short-subunit alcohol dehydrogenase family)
MERELQLAGQTVLVIGGSSGIGLETAKRARAEGAEIIITARDPDRVQRAGLEVEGSIAAFDATDFERLSRFFDELQKPVDHVLVTGPRAQDVPVAAFDIGTARREVEAHLLVPLQIARSASTNVRPGGTLLFTGCTNGRHGLGAPAFVSAITAALSELVKSLASDLAPTRVNVIAAGFVETPGSATELGDPLSQRVHELEMSLPIRRVIGPADVAALAVHVMTNTAVTGATFEIDGGQHVVER